MLYVIGYPDDCGGANVESFDTIKLWLEQGVDVTLLPTKHYQTTTITRLRERGCWTLKGKTVPAVDLIIPGSTVVSFGDWKFVAEAAALKEQGCRLIYVPCSTVPAKYDVEFFAKGGEFDLLIYQSHFQRTQWQEAFGYTRPYKMIPGAFDHTDFPYNPRPHEPGTTFHAGRISRPDVRKFSPDLWQAYEGSQATIMGWSPNVTARCGPPPSLSTVLKKRSMATSAFYAQLHAIVHPGGEALENWPRFVLEAMSAGVPVITDRRGGILEMIADGMTGFLCDSPRQMAEVAATLANDEGLRLAIAAQARNSLEVIANEQTIWKRWEPILEGC